jgi:hypothetical protein
LDSIVSNFEVKILDIENIKILISKSCSTFKRHEFALFCAENKQKHQKLLPIFQIAIERHCIAITCEYGYDTVTRSRLDVSLRIMMSILCYIKTSIAIDDYSKA